VLLLEALLLSVALPQEVSDARDAAERRDAIIAMCGIPANRLAVHTQDDGLGYGVMVKGSWPLSDAQARCYGIALSGPEGVFPIFEDAALGERYAMLNARDALLEAGVLDRLPVFRPRRETLAAFAVRLERLCRARPHSALKAVGDNIEITGIEPDRRDPRDFLYQHCAMQAAIASGYQVFGAMPPIPQVDLPALTPDR